MYWSKPASPADGGPKTDRRGHDRSYEISSTMIEISVPATRSTPSTTHGLALGEPASPPTSASSPSLFALVRESKCRQPGGIATESPFFLSRYVVHPGGAAATGTCTELESPFSIT